MSVLYHSQPPRMGRDISIRSTRSPLWTGSKCCAGSRPARPRRAQKPRAPDTADGAAHMAIGGETRAQGVLPGALGDAPIVVPADTIRLLMTITRCWPAVGGAEI